MRGHRNPFSIFGQLDIFKKAVSNYGRKFLDEVFDELHIQAIRHRHFTPLTTTWLFVLQVLDSDQSCRQTISSWAATLAREGRKLCSLRTGAYCRARARLPEHVLSEATTRMGHLLLRQAKRDSIFKGRTVKIVDGTTVSMPDTEKNQSSFPQWNQKKGIGFPLARLLAIFSLSTGALVELAIDKTVGKKTGEVSLFRSLRHTLAAGDLLLFDRLYTSYVDMAYLLRHGMDFVGTLHISRQLDLRKAKRLGKHEWLVQLQRPSPKDVGGEDFDQIQPSITVRVLNIDVKQKGFRTKKLIIITSLVETTEATRLEIAELYRSRWQAELDFRTIKIAMQMDVLRCQTPEMVRKEIWAHLLAYNLIRAVLMEVAGQHHLAVRQISFKAAMQLIRAALPRLPMQASKVAAFLRGLLEKLCTERIGNRPDRIEPRAVKRRPKPLPRLMVPRDEARKALLRAS